MSLKHRRGPDLKVAEGVTSPSPPSLLDQIRNMEEFAALGQYLFMFGVGALKLPDFGREELEAELLAPQSTLVEQIKLALIKMVTSNPRLLVDQFDEQAMKQYLLSKPEANPFRSADEIMRSFADMDVFTKIRVLHQLSEWTFIHPNQLREKMGDVDISEELSWRMDPIGFDSKENIYYILDDNRLYRRAPWRKATMSTKKKVPAREGRKRRRVSIAANDSGENPDKVDHGRKWSCVCISVQDWEDFVTSLKASKDPDESSLYKYLKGDVLPEIHRAEEVRQKKFLGLEKERQKQEAVANRKRSSRIDEKMTRKKEEEEKAAKAFRQEELLRKAQVEQRKRGKEREARLAARERENKAREKQLQAQEFGSRATSYDDSSVSGRRSSARVQIRRLQRSLSNDESNWVFDCSCGVHGIQYEDGSKIIACDKCDIWQHLKCQNLPPSFTEGDFTCERCRSREDVSNHRVTIKLRIDPPTKISTDTPKSQGRNTPSTSLKILNQPKEFRQASQVMTPNESRLKTSLASRCSNDALEQDYSEPLANLKSSTLGNSQVNSVMNNNEGENAGEGSTQASADFLLLMADPGHNTSGSQQPSIGNTDTTSASPNVIQRSGFPIPHKDKTKAQLQSSRLVGGTSTAVPGSITNFSPPPERPSNYINLPGNNAEPPYHPHPHTQIILAGSVTSANA